MQLSAHTFRKVIHISAKANRGGTEKNCFHFIKGSPQLLHSVFVLGTEGPMVDDWRKLGITVQCLAIQQLNPISFLMRLMSISQDFDADALIYWSDSRLPWVLGGLSNVKFPVYVHVGNPYVKSVKRNLLEFVVSLGWKIPKEVHLRAVSQYVRESLHKSRCYKRFPVKVSLKPIELPEGKSTLPRLIELTDEVRIGMVARLDIIKDHATVLYAFCEVKKKYSNATLHLAGEGLLRANLEQLARKLNLQDSIVFYGDVKDVFGFLQQLDLFVYATTMQEGLSGTIAEAMGMGIPCVATDLPMLREWDSDGQLVEWTLEANPIQMAFSICRLLGDWERRKMVALLSVEHIRKNFSPIAFICNYLSR